GYQAGNTLGRSLIEGARKVKLFGETINVAAEIKQLPGVSGHADMNGLLAWAEAVKGVKKFFVNHGEASSAESFAQVLRERLKVDAYAPYSGAEFDITEGIITVDAQPIPIPKKKNTANMNPNYIELSAAAERLSQLIKMSDGRANADMRKLTDAINALCDEWQL
ncbi:MAG: MBL fold metallo-hydrolase, partial [Ruminococcus sp.]|nr:MBL fold metallo-hydrolase [Ruminococcus sp.]